MFFCWNVRTSGRLDVGTSGRLDSYENAIKEELYFDNFWGIQRVFYLCNQSQAFI